MKSRLFLLLVVCLVAISCDQRPSADRRLDVAIAAGDTNYLQRHFSIGGSVNQSIKYMPFGKISAPLLDIAVRHGQSNVVSFLLGKGADPNQRDSTGDTPLIWAIARGGGGRQTGLAITKMLLEGGANPNLAASSRYGWTPLIWAVELDQLETVEILLAAGAQASATNHEGLTALHFSGKAAIARLLIEGGADPIALTGGETPTESAIRRRKFEVLSVLTNLPAQKNRVRADEGN